MTTEALKAAAHFRRLSDESLGRLAERFEQREFGANEDVYTAGEPADALFVVASGTVITWRDPAPAGSRPLARLRRGDVVGVADFFDRERRSESARTTEAAVLLQTGKGQLLGFLEAHPQVELNLRLAAARDLTARARVTLAVAQRQAVRHRVHQEVRLTPAGADPMQATLIDLSTLGMSLRGAPDRWRQGEIVRYRLAWKNRRHELIGRVAWREAGELGIELHNPTTQRRTQLQETLELMLRSAA